MKTRFVFTLLCLSVLLGTFTDCAVQKRHYRKGLYISWNKPAPGKDVARVGNRKEVQPLKQEPAEIAVLKQEEPVMASAAKNYEGEMLKHHKKVKLSPDSCGDVILLRNGEELRVKVIEISPTTVRYKRC